MARTTLTLDPDVARLVDEEVHRQRKTVKDVINDALRKALGGSGRARSSKPFRVTPHHTGLRAGYDRAGFNKLADELEDEAVMRGGRRK